MVKFLLKQNVNIEHESEYRETGFIIACEYDYEKIAIYLIKKNTNIE